MRGWGWLSRPISPTTLKEARQAFERALEIDPRSNDARIGLAKVLSIADLVPGGPVSLDIPRAEQLLVEAIERDPSSSRAHEAMGGVRLRQKNRLREMQIEYETALALDRNNLNAVRQLGCGFRKPRRTRGLHCTGGKSPAAQPARSVDVELVRATGQLPSVLESYRLGDRLSAEGACGSCAGVVDSLLFGRGVGPERRSRRGQGVACRGAQAETGDELDRQFS